MTHGNTRTAIGNLTPPIATYLAKPPVDHSLFGYIQCQSTLIWNGLMAANREVESTESTLTNPSFLKNCIALQSDARNPRLSEHSGNSHIAISSRKPALVWKKVIAKTGEKLARIHNDRHCSPSAKESLAPWKCHSNNHKILKFRRIIHCKWFVNPSLVPGIVSRMRMQKLLLMMPVMALVLLTEKNWLTERHPKASERLWFTSRTVAPTLSQKNPLKTRFSWNSTNPAKGHFPVQTTMFSVDVIFPVT